MSEHPIAAHVRAFTELVKQERACARRQALEEAAESINEIDDGEAPEYRACQEHIRALIHKTAA